MIVREAQAQDEAGLAALAAASPDGGAVAFTPEQHVPALQIAREHEISECFVADADGGIAGSGQLDIGTCRFEGDDVRYALLSTLRVHPDYRRRGVAAELTERRLRRAAELAGQDVVAVAYIQAGNAASLGNARRWATQVGGRRVVTPVPMRRRPPRPRPGLTVRPAEGGELAEVAARIDAFYAGHDFARRWNETLLGDWLAASPFPDPVNHCLVVADRSGRLLADLGLHEQGLFSLVIGHLPAHLRAANAVLRVVPGDGRMRNLIADKAWFGPGQLDAARYLWEVTRWEWRDAGTSLLLTHDPRSPVHDVVAAQPWLPTTSATVAVRARRPMRPQTIVEQL